MFPRLRLHIGVSNHMLCQTVDHLITLHLCTTAMGSSKNSSERGKEHESRRKRHHEDWSDEEKEKDSKLLLQFIL
jgi:cytochrome b subunit of formate dehydrogenase